MKDIDFRISEEYIFIIDTDHFADFAGELAAYCTGNVSEDESEDIALYADKANEELDINPFLDITVEKENFEGAWRNYSIWPSRIWGINDDGKPIKLAEENKETPTGIAGFSVGIYFDTQLEPTTIALLKDRAKRYFENYKPNVKVEDFRLISHIKTAREIPI